jgi:hypothetical protein
MTSQRSANRIILLLILVNLVYTELFSQHIILRPEFSYGTFNMNETKVLLNTRPIYIGPEPKTLSSFPSYYGYGLSVINSFGQRFALGLTGDFYTTGGRNYYADYSGSYSYDLLVSSVNLGIVAGYGIPFAKRHKLGLELTGGKKFSFLKEEEKLVLSTNGYDNSYYFRGGSLFIKPVIRYDFSIAEILSVGAYFGAEYNPKSYPHDKNNNYLEDYLHHKISINWSGIRFGLHCSLKLFRENLPN